MEELKFLNSEINFEKKKESIEGVFPFRYEHGKKQKIKSSKLLHF